jgi:UDP-N-acetyl-D-mannosaminuronic acid dehydrogenase
VLVAPDAATAAATKVFEGIYRDVNLALANELAVLSQPLGVDANEAIDLANTQPFCALHDPGPGVGGHCIPVYPYFVIDGVGRDASLLRTARAVNDAMPRRAVELIERVLATTGTDLGEATVLLLGLTYKENVAELRNAPGPEIAHRLSAAGASVLAVDPLVADWSAVAAEPIEPAAALDREVDTVALVTAHDEFEQLDWAAFGAPVVDGHAAVEAPPEVPVYRIGGRWPGAGAGVDR